MLQSRPLPIILTVVIAITACGDDPPTTPSDETSEPDEPQVASVVVTPGADTLTALGQTVDLSAAALDSNGAEISGIEFTWNCGDACGVASVEEATGVVEAKANGTATITATAQGTGISDGVVVSVGQVPTAVEVSPGSGLLNTVGSTEQFSAVATDANGNEITNAQLLWLSSDHDVATIDQNGLATATGSGTVTITAAARGVPGTAELVVDQNASILAFVVQPTSAQAGESLSPAIQVEIQDGAGERVVDSRVAVTLTLETNPGGGTLGGTRTVNAVDGIASFSGLWIGKVGNGYSISAGAEPEGSDATVISTTSEAFDIAAGPPSQLAFTQQPTDVVGNEPFASIVTVAIQDEFGNAVPTASNAVTLEFEENPGNASLLGTRMVNAVNGVATFNDLRIDRPGEAYTITAFVDGVAPVISSRFDVSLTFAQVEAGFRHVCGVTLAGHAYCWGWNGYGQLGDGTDELRASPVLVIGNHTFSTVSAGRRHTCALTTDNAIYCWGQNGAGQLGIGTQDFDDHPQPVEVTGGHQFVRITVGFSHTCAINMNNEAFCWGENFGGQLGVNSTDDQFLPSPVADAVSGAVLFTSIDAGQFHTCGVTTDTEAYCWGSNVTGQLGDSTTDIKLVPTPVHGGHEFAAVSAGDDHSCGIVAITDGDTEAYCWGENIFGQLGDGSTTSDSIPVQVTGFSGADAFTGITAGDEHSCAIRSTSTERQAYCWGWNADGQLGDGTNTDTSTRVAVSGALPFVLVSAGGSHTCGITAASVTYCWGGGANGELGHGIVGVNSNVPVEVIQ